MIYLLLLFVSGILALQTSWVQTKLAVYAAQKLSEATGTTIKLDRIHIRFFDELELRGLYVEDLHHDTLLYSQSLLADIEGLYLGYTQIDFDKVKLESTVFNVKQYANEDDLNIQFLIDFFDPPKKVKTPRTGRPFSLFFWNVDLNNVTFSYSNLNYSQKSEPELMNFDNMKFDNISGQIKEFRIVDDSLTGKVNRLKFKEKSGFEVQQLTSDLTVAYSTMSFYNMLCYTGQSTFKGNFKFDYDSYGQLSDFVEKVYIKSKINRSLIYLNDLRYFSKELAGFNLPVVVSGRCKGTIDNLDGINVELIAGSDTRFNGNFSISGLPDIDSTFFDLQITEFRTTQQGLGQIPNYPFNSNTNLAIPDDVAKLGTIIYHGRILGKLDDFYSMGTAYTSAGDLDLNARLNYDETKNDYSYSGKLQTLDFAIGNLLYLPGTLDRIALQTEFKGSSFDMQKMEVTAKGNIDRFDFNGYLLNQINYNLTVEKNIINGTVSARDKEADFDFTGMLNLTKGQTQSDFDLSIRRLNISALKLLQLDSTLIFTGEVSARMNGSQLDDLDGSASIENSQIQFGTYTYNINEFKITASKTATFKSLDLKSDIADLKIEGDYNLEQLPYFVGQSLNNYLPSFTLINIGQKPLKSQSQMFSYSAKIKDFQLINHLFDIPLAFYGKNEIWGHYNSESEWLRLRMVSDRFSVSDYSFTQSTIDAHNTTGLLELNFNSRQFAINDSISLFNIKLRNQFNGDSAGIQMEYANHAAPNSELADVRAIAKFDNSKIDLSVLPSYILIGDSVWIVNEGNHIEIDTGRVRIKDFSLEHNEQFVRFNGAISKDKKDELDIFLSNFRLSTLNPIFKDDGFSIRGRAEGFVSISNVYDKPVFKSDLNILRFGLNDEIFGTLKVKNQWVNENQSLLVAATLTPQDLPSLAIKGRIFPYKKDQNLDLEVNLDRFRLSVVKNYLKDVFSNMDGYAFGKIDIDGSLNKPLITGVVNVRRGRLTVGYLNTTYTFPSQDVIITSNEIAVKKCEISDSEGTGTGTVDFSLTHQNFNNIKFNTVLECNKLLALNTNETMNELFFGRAFASGKARIFGTTDHITFDIKAKTEKGTLFSLPLYGSSEVSQDNFITFVNKKDTSSAQIKTVKAQTIEGITIDMQLDVTPDATAEIIFDPTVGDKIQGSGKGNLQISLSPDGKFQLFGDYVIQSGDYLFTLENIVSKRFEVEQGSSIVWYGDPLNATININAIYRLNTPLFPIVQQFDTSSARRKPVPVEAVLKMKNKLLTPDLGFEIRLPNSDQVSRDLLISQIQTENELNKQFFGLLVLGQFLPNVGGVGQSASLNSTIGANAREFLSSQISNWLSKLSDDVNIGVNYRQNGATGGDQVNVSVSKQFSNRVSVDGNVGMINNNAAATTSNQGNNFIGEFNIEYKVTEDGRFRVRAFNRSNQYNLINNEFPYTQGVSIFYRRDFELFRDLFKKKATTEEPK